MSIVLLSVAEKQFLECLPSNPDNAPRGTGNWWHKTVHCRKGWRIRPSCQLFPLVVWLSSKYFEWREFYFLHSARQNSNLSQSWWKDKLFELANDRQSKKKLPRSKKCCIWQRCSWAEMQPTTSRSIGMVQQCTVVLQCTTHFYRTLNFLGGGMRNICQMA